jgi:pimeloyl-ACP methyl ester carboxylesterase
LQLSEIQLAAGRSARRPDRVRATILIASILPLTAALALRRRLAALAAGAMLLPGECTQSSHPAMYLTRVAGFSRWLDTYQWTGTEKSRLREPYPIRASRPSSVSGREGILAPFGAP